MNTGTVVMNVLFGVMIITGLFIMRYRLMKLREMSELGRPLLGSRGGTASHRLDTATREAAKGYNRCAVCAFENFKASRFCTICGESIVALEEDAYGDGGRKQGEAGVELHQSSASINAENPPTVVKAGLTQRQIRARKRKEWTRKLDIEGKMFWYREYASAAEDSLNPGFVVSFHTTSEPAPSPASAHKPRALSPSSSLEEEKEEREEVVLDVDEPEWPEDSLRRQGSVSNNTSDGAAEGDVHETENTPTETPPQPERTSPDKTQTAMRKTPLRFLEEEMFVRVVEASKADAAVLATASISGSGAPVVLDAIERKKEISEQVYALNPNSHRDNGEDHLVYYYAAGRLVGRALLEGVSMQWIAEHDDIESLALDFSATTQYEESGERLATNRRFEACQLPLLSDDSLVDHRIDAAKREAEHGFVACTACGFENFTRTHFCAICGAQCFDRGDDALMRVALSPPHALSAQQVRARKRKEWTRKIDVHGRMFWYRSGVDGNVEGTLFSGYTVRFEEEPEDEQGALAPVTETTSDGSSSNDGEVHPENENDGVDELGLDFSVSEKIGDKIKRLLIAQKEREPSWTQETLALWAKDVFALETKPTQATVSNILRARDRLCATDVPETFRSARPVKHPTLDSTISDWVLDALARDEPLTRDAIRERAVALAKEMHLETSVAFSKGWVVSFMKRHQLQFRARTADTGDGPIEVVRRPTVSTVDSDASSEPLVAHEGDGLSPQLFLESSPTVSGSSMSNANNSGGRPAQRMELSTARRANGSAAQPVPEAAAQPQFALQLSQPLPLQQAAVKQGRLLATQQQQPAPESSPQPQQLPAQEALPPPSKKRRQSRRSSALTPDKEKEQHLFALECRKLQVDIEAKQVQLTVEKTLARKKLLDAGIPAEELDKLIPM
ncbi:hypothetical protein PybrP1_000965 [[Pythium] brassicae (nom. inval.)]|nr:hypothetical protein PybrP1_000965 [[Pythium] brassicae (nom. inval.)]